MYILRLFIEPKTFLWNRVLVIIRQIKISPFKEFNI